MRGILQRYEQGERIEDIAAEYGCTDKSLYRQLLVQCPEEWQSHQASHALAELLTWNQAVKTAPDALELNRAREGLRSAQWQLERLCRRLYGQQSEPETRGVVAIQINLGGNGAMQSHQVEAKPDPDGE
jgi:transposase-like protein